MSGDADRPLVTKVLKDPTLYPYQFLSWLDARIRRAGQLQEVAGRAGSGGTSGITREVQIFVDTPDATGLATAGIVGGFSNMRRLLPYLSHSGDCSWNGFIRVPPDYGGTPQLIIEGVVNATTGAVRLIAGTASVAAGASEDPTFTDETAQNVNVPGTALLRFDTTFSITGSTPAAGKDLAVRIKRNAGNAADTCTASFGIWAVAFRYVTA